MTTELPEPWASALGPKGIHSYRDLGAAAGIAHETARRLCTAGRTSSKTVNRVAAALFGGDSTRVWAMYGSAVQDYGPWELPPEASLLRPDQRSAVLAVVKAMLPNEAGRTMTAGGDESGDTAPTKQDLTLIAHHEEHSIEDEQNGLDGK